MRNAGDTATHLRQAAGIAILLAASPLVFGAQPVLSELSTPAAGHVMTASWSGVIPTGLNGASICQEAFDAHMLRLDDAGNNQRRLSLEVQGPVGTDLVVSLVRPNGNMLSSDGGVARSTETLTLNQPEPGVYGIRVCARRGATPQPYTGQVVLRADEPVSAEARRLFLPAGSSSCAAPAQSLKFEQNYIDTARAGGEPFIAKHPDGQLLWGSHAGTTHFYAPTAASPATAPFIENYVGQTYYYVAEADDGYADWTFVPRVGPGPGDVAPLAGLPASGFSDPEFAFDSAGNVFVSEINLVNVAVSKSTDGGRSYGLQNVISFSVSDRQWMAADREDELYMAASGFGGGSVPGGPLGEMGHFIAKSTDGGVTFGAPFTIDPIIGDIQIDKERGILYSLHHAGGNLEMARFPNIREEDSDFTVEILQIAPGTGMSGVQRLIDPTFDLDSEGNLYVTWYENGTALRPQGVYYAYSMDQGETWTAPLRVDESTNDEVWPWIAVGDPGQVAIAWLGTDSESGESLPGEAGDRPWHVMVAHSSNGLGCGGEAIGSELAAFTVTRASDEPPHTGTICQQGTICQAQAIDRRLGDYFSLEVAADGPVHIAMADTRQGGAVSLPSHIRQIDGPRLVGTPAAAPRVAPPTAPAATTTVARGGAAFWLLALAVLATALRRSSLRNLR